MIFSVEFLPAPFEWLSTTVHCLASARGDFKGLYIHLGIGFKFLSIFATFRQSLQIPILATVDKSCVVKDKLITVAKLNPGLT